MLPCCTDYLTTVGRILYNITEYRGSTSDGTPEEHTITKSSILEIELIGGKTYQRKKYNITCV